MSTDTFYVGQSDYLYQLNQLATANDLTDIQTGIDTVDAAVTTTTTNAAASTNAASSATSSASTATAEAIIATTQASIATAQATNSASSATASASSAADSQYWAGQSHADQMQVDWNQSVSAAVDFIKNKPTLGSSAALNVPSSGNASSAQVVKGNDTRLPIVGVSTGQVPIWNNTTSTWGIGTITPGLSNFTESLNTTSPNDVTSVVSLAASGSATNIDHMIAPKGTGSIITSIPDGTSTGGNKRGQYTVDLQLIRSGAYSVAASDYGVLAGGFDNAIAVSSNYSVVSGGYGNACSGKYSTIPGGTGATTRNIDGYMAWNSGSAFSIRGKGQSGKLIVGGNTINGTTAVTLTSTNASASTSNTLTMGNSCAYFIKVTITVREGDSPNRVCCGEGRALVTTGVGASTILLIGTPTFSWTFTTSGFTLPLPSLAVNTTRGSFDIIVTGLASKFIYWSALLETTEMA